MQLQLSGTANDSIVDGPGIRFTIFVQGCPHHCPGCHNPQTQPFEGGTPTDSEELLEKIRNNGLLDGVTFSGGEPFSHASALAELGKEIRKLGLDIVTYTGYTFEYLFANMKENGIGELLAVTDLLVDGPFILEQRSLDVPFRGSKNQRIIDVKKSLALGHAVEAEI